MYTRAVIVFFVVLIGVCMGSFGNVLIDRLPAGRSIVGRSQCDGCGRVLRAFELIPLVSWLFLRGKCSTCHASITARLPLVEAFAGILAASAFAYVDGDLLLTAIFFLGLWSLLLIAVIDTHTNTIPDVLTALTFVAGLAFHWLQSGTVPVYGPIIAAAFFALQWILSRGKWVGSGDILLAAAIGMMLGTVHDAIWLLLLSYIVGAATATALLLAKQLQRGAAVPFGPFLVIAAYVVLFLGKRLP